jgi:hypothetical protein
MSSEEAALAVAPLVGSGEVLGGSPEPFAAESATPAPSAPVVNASTGGEQALGAMPSPSAPPAPERSPGDVTVPSPSAPPIESPRAANRKGSVELGLSGGSRRSSQPIKLNMASAPPIDPSDPANLGAPSPGQGEGKASEKGKEAATAQGGGKPGQPSFFNARKLQHTAFAKEIWALGEACGSLQSVQTSASKPATVGQGS